MKILTGTVVDGRVEITTPLENGMSVTVLVPEKTGDFSLSAEEVRELQESIDEAARGEVVDGWRLLADLPG